MSNIYKYVITHDAGTAPCVDNELLSLCICKPVIRRTAQIGDWIIATAGKGLSQYPKIIYAAKISDIISMHDYAQKFSNRMDSIYHSDGGSLTHYGGAIHSTTENQLRDKRGLRCILSKEFWYFGREMIELPDTLNSLYHFGRGHSKLTDENMLKEIEYFLSNYKVGVNGQPNHS